MEEREAWRKAVINFAVHSIVKITLDEILTIKFDSLGGRTIPE